MSSCARSGKSVVYCHSGHVGAGDVVKRDVEIDIVCRLTSFRMSAWFYDISVIYGFPF